MSRIWPATCLLPLIALGQNPPPKPEFEVADIRPNRSNENDYARALPGGEISVRNKPFREIVSVAFSSRPDTPVLGGPPWIGADRFDITGKAQPGTPDETLELMLQSLLIKEFKLEAHIEQRPTDSYALVVGKNGPKLAKATGSGKPVCGRRVGGGQDPAARGMDAGQAELVCTNVTMADLAMNLPKAAPTYVDHDVVDLTGIDGIYDVTLNWVSAAVIDQGGLTMFDAVDKQLGLKLEARKLPRPVIVIDHVEKLVDDK